MRGKCINSITQSTRIKVQNDSKKTVFIDNIRENLNGHRINADTYMDCHATAIRNYRNFQSLISIELFINPVHALLGRCRRRKN